MTGRKAVLTVCGLVALLVAVYLPATALFNPSASPVAVVGGSRIPSSTIDPLPEFSRQVIWVNYTSNGTAGLSGVFWTELWYQVWGDPTWKLYAPPWNPSGKWAGAPLNSPMYAEVGTILFDTFWTGGEARYNFTTVAVDRGFYREAGPDHAKAKTMVDTRAPSIFIGKPTPGAWTNTNDLTWLAQDEVSGVAKVEISVDGGAFQAYPDASGSTTMALDGKTDHVVSVRATDRAGNSATVSVPFHYDPNAPSLTITSPSQDYVKSGDVTVEWTAEDTGAGIESYQLTVDSNAPVLLPGTATSYDLRGLDERGHVISLLALDKAGNLAAQTKSFGVDVSPPSLSLVQPASGSYVNLRQIQAVWSASDAVSGIDRYEVQLDSGEVRTVTGTASWTFGEVAEGAHTVKVKAFDRAGNVAEATATVTVDVTPPDLTVSAPESGATVYGTVSVNWTASDALSGIAEVVVVRDGTANVVPAGARTFTLTPLPIGLHYVTVRAWDKAGNLAEVTVPFAYGGPTVPGPGGAGLPAIDFWIVMAIIGAIAVVSAYLAVRRRKKAKA